MSGQLACVEHWATCAGHDTNAVLTISSRVQVGKRRPKGARGWSEITQPAHEGTGRNGGLEATLPGFKSRLCPCFVTLGKFLNVSEPVSSFVKWG